MIFNYSTWIARYPEFSEVAEQTAQMYFDEATLYCDNTAESRVPEAQRAVLLNMLTSHIAFIASRDAESVGRISSASEGSVSVSMAITPGTGEWYQQSKYGAAYWQVTLQYRKARIYPGVNRIMDPWRRR